MNYLKKIITFTIIFACSGVLGINLKLETAIKNSDVHAVKQILLTAESLNIKDKDYYLNLCDEIINLRRNSIDLLFNKQHYEGHGWSWVLTSVLLAGTGIGIGLGGPIAEDRNDPFIPKLIAIPVFILSYACYQKAKELGFSRISSKRKYENALTVKRLVYESIN